MLALIQVFEGVGEEEGLFNPLRPDVRYIGHDNNQPNSAQRILNF